MLSNFHSKDSNNGRATLIEQDSVHYHLMLGHDLTHCYTARDLIYDLNDERRLIGIALNPWESMVNREYTKPKVQLPK